MKNLSRRPDWLKKKIDFEGNKSMTEMLKSFNLNTVCQGAKCPNISECFKNRTATFMIMGNFCTRNCKFCAIEHKKPEKLNPEEPKNIALASKKLNLKHIVVTSVTRDDLPDHGANHFAETIYAIKKYNPQSTVEVLIPDMPDKYLDIIIKANPQIINHNMETVKSIFDDVRPMGNFNTSLHALKYIKTNAPKIYSKSGIMVGLGETQDEVLDLMDKLREIDCDIFTIGQYLPPSANHALLKDYITPETFKMYEEKAYEKGFKFVSAGPYVRSSYNAANSLERLL